MTHSKKDVLDVALSSQTEIPSTKNGTYRIGINFLWSAQWSLMFQTAKMKNRYLNVFFDVSDLEYTFNRLDHSDIKAMKITSCKSLFL